MNPCLPTLLPPATASRLSPFSLHSPSFFPSLPYLGFPQTHGHLPISPSTPVFLHPQPLFSDPRLEPKVTTSSLASGLFQGIVPLPIPGCRRSRALEIGHCLFNERKAQASILTRSLASALIFNQLNTESGRRESVLPACVLIRNATPGCRPR